MLGQAQVRARLAQRAGRRRLAHEQAEHRPGRLRGDGAPQLLQRQPGAVGGAPVVLRQRRGDALAESRHLAGRERQPHPAVARRLVRHRRLERRLLVGAEVPKRREARQVDAARRLEREQRRQRLRRVRRVEGGERRQPLRLAAPARRREGVDDDTAAEGVLRRLVAHDEAVAVQRADRPVERELHPARGPRRDGVALEHDDARADVARPEVQVHRRPVRERPGGRVEQVQPGVDARGRRVRARGDDPVAALDVALLQPAAGEVERQALAGAALLRLAVLRMQAAHAHLQAARRDHQPVARRDRARHRGAGHHRADAGEREAAVDGEAEVAALARAWQVGGEPGEALAERLDALAGDRGHRHQLGAGQPAAGEHGAHLGLGLGEAPGPDQVALGQRHHAARQAEQVDDRQVLARLRHRAVVGGDDEQHRVDAGGAGEHVAHQPLVAGNVDEAEHAAALQRLVGEAEVDGDAARLLFLQAVGVDAGERLHQRGLPVVDVTCSADDQDATLEKAGC